MSDAMERVFRGLEALADMGHVPSKVRVREDIAREMGWPQVFARFLFAVPAGSGMARVCPVCIQAEAGHDDEAIVLTEDGGLWGVPLSACKNDSRICELLSHESRGNGKNEDAEL